MSNSKLSYDYLIYNKGMPTEELYIFNGTLVDIVEEKIIINIGKVIVSEYWRRNIKYEIGIQLFTVFVSPKIKLFERMEDDEERLRYVERNWKNLLRIALSNIHKDYFEIKDTGYTKIEPSYEEIYDKNGKKDVCSFFKELCPDLKTFQLYNGYNSEILGCEEIK